MSDTSIVCVSMSEWGDVPHNSRHLMRVARRRGYRVVYVESLGLRTARLSGRDLRKIGRRLGRTLRPLRRVEPGYWVLTPIALPIQGNELIDRVNAWLVVVQLRATIAGLGLRPFVLWSYLPSAILLRDQLNPCAALYYRTDDYLAFPNVPVKALARTEAQAVAKADLCIGAADRYVTGALASAAKALFVPNAVDFDHYAADRPSSTGLRPRILVMGTLDSWLATELLEQVIGRLPDFELVLAGPVRTDLAKLREQPNVRYLGVVPYAELPDLLGTVAVGLIPFRENQVSAGATPGKLFQYLAAGLPVVATNFFDPGSLGVGDHVSVVSSQNVIGFERAIRAAAADQSPARRLARAQAVAGHTWEARFETIERALGISA